MKAKSFKLSDIDLAYITNIKERLNLTSDIAVIRYSLAYVNNTGVDEKDSEVVSSPIKGQQDPEWGESVPELIKRREAIVDSDNPYEGWKPESQGTNDTEGYEWKKIRQQVRPWKLEGGHPQI